MRSIHVGVLAFASIGLTSVAPAAGSETSHSGSEVTPNAPVSAGQGEPTELPPPPAVSGQVCRDLTAQIDTVLTSPGLEGAKVGVYVEQLNNGEVLYHRREDDLLIPASNVKLVSTAAALDVLGPDYRFTSEIYGDLGSDGIIKGDIVLRGNGDPWLVPERVWYLANRLFYQGVRKVQGDLVVDDTYFAGPRLANGAEQDLSSAAYMAPAGAVSVGFNTVLVHVYPSKTAGSPAEILVEPRQAYTSIQNQAVTVSRGRTWLTVDVVADGDRSQVQIKGRISARDSGRGYYRRVDNPPLFAGEVLKQALKEAGVTVKGKVRLGNLPEGADRLAQVASPRLSEIVSRINKYSNNFMAEQVALAAGAHVHGAPATWEKAQDTIEQYVTRTTGISADQFEIKNASGLHDVNRFTPRQLVRVLRSAYRDPRLGPEYVASMSVAGASGTLSGRMSETSADRILRAKTGTLSIASALSGYVTAKSGETLGFSILVNNYQTAISEIWAAQDEIGTALAQVDRTCEVPNGRPVAASGQARGTSLP